MYLLMYSKGEGSSITPSPPPDCIINKTPHSLHYIMPTAKKAYSFTLNNYSENEYETLSSVLRDEGQYGIIGREVGASGTPHLQGYVMFKRPYHFSTIKDRYLPRCHIEVSAGSPAANRSYCSKDGNFVEFGSCPSAKRTRDELGIEFSKQLEHGRTGLVSFAAENPGTFYFSGHNLLRNALSLSRPAHRPNINVKWYVGKPGTGKSRQAHETFPDGYIKDPRTKWWNGYLMEKEVIIDDFGPGGIDINHLLRWFDRYKCLVENKGGMLPLVADSFIVTSNFLPSEVFQTRSLNYDAQSSNPVFEDHPQLPALMRRITIVPF